MKSLALGFFLIFSCALFAQDAFTVSTFHNISVYWSPDDGSIDNDVLVEYKKTTDDTWKNALSMKYNPIIYAGLNPITGLRYDKADYRGSVVNLTPNTAYEIRLTLEGTIITNTVNATTWSEDFPIGETIDIGDLSTQYTVTTAGTADAYLLIDGTGSTIDITDGSDQCILLNGAGYVIIRGFTLLNGKRFGIRLIDCKNIVIENCDISQWGEEDIEGTGFGKGYQAAIMGFNNSAVSCVFQRNKIHHPKWDTNSWAELHDPESDPDDHSNYHPDGPQGISLEYCYEGNNIIRYNEFWSDTAHYFNDIVGYGPNGSYNGFPGDDSDIYGNYLANCFDDGIESEGGNTNVRIWNNYIEEVFIGIGNAATSIGPLYIWRNITARGFSHEGSVYGDYGGFLKMGYASSLDWMTGQMYIFNNTILQKDDHGLGGLGTADGANRYIRHCETRNNIFNVRTATTNSIAIRPDGHNIDNDFDYDLMNHPYPDGFETNGFIGMPTYSLGEPIFDFTTKSGDFTLNSSSLGFDEGEIIPNFTDNYMGDGPDVGAHEAGTDPFVVGVDAEFIPFVDDLKIDEIKLEYAISIYPNPTNKILNIQTTIVYYNMQIIDLTGKIIETNIIAPEINIEHLSNGIYILQIVTEQNRVNKQFIKQ